MELCEWDILGNSQLHCLRYEKAIRCLPKRRIPCTSQLIEETQRAGRGLPRLRAEQNELRRVAVPVHDVREIERGRQWRCRFIQQRGCCNQKITTCVVAAAKCEHRDGCRARYAQYALKWCRQKSKSWNLVQETHGLPVGGYGQRAGQS